MTLGAFAHSSNTKGVRQTLDEHLSNVAALARQFASAFHQEKTAEYIAWVHDLGKIKESWQTRLKLLEAGERPAWEELHSDHQMASAAYVYHTSQLAALLIAGHHGGLPDFSQCMAEIESGKWEAGRREIAEKIQARDAAGPRPDSIPSDYFQLMMLFSCLVDADCIDTAAHFDHGSVTPQFPAIHELLDRMMKSAEVQAVCPALRDACLVKAADGRGFFSLRVPGGSGKTVSGGLFASSHATRQNLRRMVCVASYRGIIDDNVDIYSRLFGEENVLSHHATADLCPAPGETEKMQIKLAENWDEPVVVTTAEQFFESLYSGRPGAARKLHNLVNSMIIVDEPQALPLRVLMPCMAALKALVSQFGCSVLFVSANTPALEVFRFLGGGAVKKIADHAFAVAPRVAVDLERFRNCEWSDVSRFMSTTKQALSIANTNLGALRIFRGLPVQSRIYLGTWLCPAHRKEVIRSIKTTLQSGADCHVASTQVIEAGLDLSSPDVVLREKGPLDSLLQAFGLCKRDGKIEGRCYVFCPKENSMPADYEKAISCVNQLLYKSNREAFDPETLTKYFEMLYGDSNLDAQEIMKHAEALEFKTIREGSQGTEEGGMGLVADGQVHLVCDYGTAEQRKTLEEAISASKERQAAGEMIPRWALRRLQRHIVSVSTRTLERLCQASPLALEHLCLNFYRWDGSYSTATGLGDVIDRVSSARDEE